MVTPPDRIVTPGESIGNSDNFNAGVGVCLHEGQLIATLVGHLTQQPRTESNNDKPTLIVKSFKQVPTAVLPDIKSVVRAKIIRISPRAAHAEILVVDGRPLKEVFKGMIRQHDVRQTEIDKVEIYKCFAPGDVVAAEVISLGDRHQYFLSTAKNELGVVYAKSRSGVPMIPVNWQEMQCPATKTKEFRKVAKQ